MSFFIGRVSFYYNQIMGNVPYNSPDSRSYLELCNQILEEAYEREFSREKLIAQAMESRQLKIRMFIQMVQNYTYLTFSAISAFLLGIIIYMSVQSFHSAAPVIGIISTVVFLFTFLTIMKNAINAKFNRSYKIDIEEIRDREKTLYNSIRKNVASATGKSNF